MLNKKRKTTLNMVVVQAATKLDRELGQFTIQNIIDMIHPFFKQINRDTVMAVLSELSKTENGLLIPYLRRIKNGLYKVNSHAVLVPNKGGNWVQNNKPKTPTEHLWVTTIKRGIVTAWDKEIHRRMRRVLIPLNYEGSIYNEMDFDDLLSLYQDLQYSGHEVMLIGMGYDLGQTFVVHGTEKRIVHGAEALRWYAFVNQL
ncbi:MAG: hypothetical protein JSV42_02835 [Chloroflexota bacterium]|nr:MAG: hypothetical protein JSV42_02835 [Chloroflexota bacterium]